MEDLSILEITKQTIADDLTIYKNSLFLHEDDFWTDDKLVTHHDEHVDYLNRKFTGKAKRVNGKVRLLMPSFADSELLDEYDKIKDKSTAHMTEAEYDRYLKEKDELEDEIWNSSIDKYNDVANEFMNNSSYGGWKCLSYSGKYTPYVYVRTRTSPIDSISNLGYCEYVMFEPVFSRDNRLIRRKVMSYGLTRTADLNLVFPNGGDVIEESLEPVLTRVTEALLTEANRQQLLQKSRKGRNYAPSNQYKGRNRYERRMKSSISATVRDYNMIQMDPLFKRDKLEFKIPVMGETDVYVVDVRVDGLLSEIRQQLMNNKGELEFKVVLQSLIKVLNMGNVYIGCNCPDAKYRQAYWQTANDYKAGYFERRPSNKTNPNDDLGAGCKHVLLVLANLDWAVKVASVINNYIKYCKEHLQRNYADYIFPKVYGIKYDKAVQLNLFDNGLFPEDRKTMDTVIGQGFVGKDNKGKFVKGNEYRFQKKEPEEEPETDENPLDLKFSNEEEPEEETPEIES